MAFRIALVLAGALVAAFAPTADAQQFNGDGTFYGDNGWEGSCAGNIGGQWHAGTWPPAGSYLSSMQPGSSTPINVALNSAQYSTAMCGKLLWVKATNSGCTTCGTTPISSQYILARVTNLCPECQYGSLDLGIQGDGRWKITWKWADSGVATQSIGGVSRASVPATKAKVATHNHSAAYYRKIAAALQRKAARAAAALRRKAAAIAAKRRAAARAALQRKAAQAAAARAAAAAAAQAALKNRGRKLMAA